MNEWECLGSETKNNIKTDVTELGYEGGDWTGLLEGLTASFCEHDNELSGYLRAWMHVVADGDVKHNGLDIFDHVTK
jgi:hypothetical protein